MAVKLSEFANKLILKRDILRPKLGSAILPLMMVRLANEDWVPEYSWYSSPRSLMLLTVCRRTGVIFIPRSNDMLYSAGGAVHHCDWWVQSEVVGIRPPQIIQGNLLEVYVEINEDTQIEQPEPPNPW